MARRLDRCKRAPDARNPRIQFTLLLPLLTAAIGACIANPLSSSEIPRPPIELIVFSLDEVYPEALAVAADWRPDAQLIDATLAFIPASDPRGRWGALAFLSPSSPLEWLNVFVTEGSEGLQYEPSPGSYDTARPIGDPISPDQLLVKSQEALEIGSSNGGSEFIRNRGNSMRWPQNLYLHYADDVNQTGPVVWRVDYFIPRDPPWLSLKINAETGELLDSTLGE